MLNSKSIGNKIATARKKNNLSQAELAKQVAISPQSVGKWERGESMPDITTLNRLAEIFGVDLNYFSDSFQTEVAATTTIEKLDRQTVEIPKTKPRKKFDRNWDMSQGNWVDADFSGLKNLKEKFNDSNIINCKFLGSELSELILNGNNIEHCDFSGSDMRNSKFEASNISKNVFTDCSLIDAKFSASEIYNSNFTNVNLSGAEFLKSEFRNNIIEKAEWKYTSFKITHLADLVFEGLIEDCTFENSSFSKVTFKNATILNTFFKCKSLKRIELIDCKVDKITYAFLKNGNANLTGVTIINNENNQDDDTK